MAVVLLTAVAVIALVVSGALTANLAVGVRRDWFGPVRTALVVVASVGAAVLAMRLTASLGWAIAVAVVAVVLLHFAVVAVASRVFARRRSAQAPGRRATEAQLREMVDMAQERGIVEPGERRMIENVFGLASTTARSVMAPRPEMIWIESDKSAGQATNLCIRSGHSRIPVIGENVDDVVGVVFLKDLVARTYHRTDGGRGVGVDEVMRPAVFVPDSKNLDELLQEMQRDNSHLAMLVDEYGGTAGLVTMEDILEEIVGEITDEYDEAEVVPFDKLGEYTYRAISRLSLEDLRTQLREDAGLEISYTGEIDDQVDTVAGLIAYEMGRVPLPGSSVATCGLVLTAEGGRDRRGRVKVTSVIVDVAGAAGGEDE